MFALFGFGVGIERLSDNSFFIHLQTGHYILDHGIPREDVYSYTASGTHWIAQSWLAELLYASSTPHSDRSASGCSARSPVRRSPCSHSASRFGSRASRVRAALISIAALGGIYTLWSERPLLIGVLFLVILCWIVEVPDCWVGRHLYVSLPVLMWVWANVHGTFALGFLYLALHFVGRWLDGTAPWQGREQKLLIAGAIAGAATLVNPYGPALVLFPLHLLQRGDILRHIIEWASPDFHKVWGQVLLLWLGVFIVVAARGKHRMSRRDLVLTLPFLGLALWALRNVALAPLVGLAVVARAVAVDDDVAEEKRASETRSPIGWVLAGVLVFVAMGLVMRAVNQPDFVSEAYPVKAMNAVDEQGLIGKRLLMDDADAAYAVLGYDGKQKVFIDDRYDMYPLELINDYFTLSNGRPGWKQIMNKYDVEVVVWERSHPLVEYLEQSGDWTRIHRDDSYVSLVRNDQL